jgi:tRNA (guanine10-N2)-methyltransferase
MCCCFLLFAHNHVLVCSHGHPHPCTSLQVFNAILGDPPYGVRAGGRKLVPKSHPIRHPGSHIPSTEPYSLTECLADLLELAAVTLVTGEG